MKIYDDLTKGMQAILRSFSSGDTCYWISFKIHVDKVDSLRNKWVDNYGTNLSSEKRRYRKNHGLPTAQGLAVPVLGMPHMMECILLVSEEAKDMKEGPFSREKWNENPPELGDFVMIKEPRNRRDYAWTWRIQNRQYGLLEQHLIACVKAGNAPGVNQETQHWTRLYPLFGGIRRQLTRMFKGARKLWDASQDSHWPGIDPDHLPMMVGFRNEDNVKALRK